MYTPCSVADLLSTTGLQLVVMVGEKVHVVVYMVVVVTMLVYPEQLVCPVGMCWVVAVSIATGSQLHVLLAVDCVGLLAVMCMKSLVLVVVIAYLDSIEVILEEEASVSLVVIEL